MVHLVKKKGLTVRLSRTEKGLIRQAARIESVVRGRQVSAGALLRDAGLRRAKSIVRRTEAEKQTAASVGR